MHDQTRSKNGDAKKWWCKGEENEEEIYEKENEFKAQRGKQLMRRRYFQAILNLKLIERKKKRQNKKGGERRNKKIEKKKRRRQEGGVAKKSF